MKVTKKIISLFIILTMCLSFAVPTMAMEPERVEIIVESEDEILEFFNSPQYDRDKIYTFTIIDQIALRSLCPNCGSGNFYGGTRQRQLDTFVHVCPYPGGELVLDYVSVYGVFAYARCSSCGYEVSLPNPSETIYYVNCSLLDMVFVARDGQTMGGGYDIHECKSTWN